jgi:hypothetical protein
MDDFSVVDFAGLRTEFGITISRTHLQRLEDAGVFPRRLKPNGQPKSRSFWRRKLVRLYLEGKSPRSTALGNGSKAPRVQPRSLPMGRDTMKIRIEAPRRSRLFLPTSVSEDRFSLKTCSARFRIAPSALPIAMRRLAYSLPSSARRQRIFRALVVANSLSLSAIHPKRCHPQRPQSRYLGPATADERRAADCNAEHAQALRHLF